MTRAPRKPDQRLDPLAAALKKAAAAPDCDRRIRAWVAKLLAGDAPPTSTSPKPAARRKGVPR